jgi:hypothetical protein
MNEAAEDAAATVARSLQRHRGKRRTEYLRALLYYAAAALELQEGRKVAAEDLFRLADALVATTPPT